MPGDLTIDELKRDVLACALRDSGWAMAPIQWAVARATVLREQGLDAYAADRQAIYEAAAHFGDQVHHRRQGRAA